MEYIPSPWERREDEGWREYDLFCKWREASPQNRRITVFARAIQSTPPTVKKMMLKYDWEQRLSAYLEFLEKERLEVMAIERREMYERHAGLAEKLQKKLSDAIDNIDPTDLSPKDITSWLDVSVKVERLSRGESTENIKLKDTTNRQQTSDKVISNERTAELACAVLEQLCMGQVDPSKLGAILQPRAVDACEAPKLLEQKTS